MTMPNLKRSATLVVQVIISGRVVAGPAGVAPARLTVELIDSISGAPFPLGLRIQADGSFGFYGPPATVLPLLAAGPYQLRVIAEAPGYQPNSVDLTIAQNASQPDAVQIGLTGASPIQTRLFNGGGLPISGLAITLTRIPVRLRGRVVRAEDLTTPIASATVELVTPSGPTLTADAAGRYEFPNPLPDVASVELRARSAGFQDRTMTYELDYTQPINTLTIGLAAS